jgi:predicted permease
MLASFIVYSAVYSPLRRPLSYPDSDRLVSFLELSSSGSGVSLGDIDEIQRQAPGLASLAAYREDETFLLSPRGLDQVRSLEARPEFFQSLGISPKAGRLFRPEDYAAAATPVALVSQKVWRTRFGTDPRILDDTLDIGGKRTRIAGVIDAGSLFDDVEIWLPAPYPGEVGRQQEKSFLAIGKLAYGTPLPVARDQVESAFRRLKQASPAEHRGWSTRLNLLADDVTAPARRSGEILMAVGAIVYLLALANAVMHMLARANAEERETAIRLALGLGRRRAALRRLFFCASEVGVSTAIALSAFLSLRRWLLARLPGEFSYIDRTIHWASFLAFVASLASATALLVFIIPWLRLLRLDPLAALRRRSERATADGGSRWNGCMIAIQSLSAVALLILAGLLGKSAWNIGHHELGIDGEGVLLVQLAPVSQTTQAVGAMAEAYQEALERLRADPRFRYVGASSDYPLGGVDKHVLACSLGKSFACKDAIYASISDQYLESIGLRTNSGRLFSSTDRNSSYPVAVISQSAAAALFPGGNAVGGDVKIRGERRTVVGVVPDAARRGVAAYGSDNALEVYVPDERKDGGLGTAKVLAVRGALKPSDAAAAVQGDLTGTFSDIQIAKMQSLDNVIDSIGSPSRKYAALLSLCVVLSSAIALAGIYSMALLAVQAERRAAAIRLALGAPLARVVFRIQGPILASFGVGTALGLGAAYAVARLATALLYGLTPSDGAIFLTLPSLFLLAAVLLSFAPMAGFTRQNLPALLGSE